MLVALCVIVALPVLVSTVTTLLDGWIPVGDDAALAVRAGDVLRGDPPSTGLPSGTEAVTGEAVDHLGPLEAWVAAIPYAILGPPGLLLTIAAVNVASLVVGVRIGWRRGGPPLAVAVTAAGLLLCWSLGAAIHEPIPSQATLIPWFAFLLLCWDVRLGAWRSLPLAVVAASWVTQAHLLYVPMTVVVALGTAVLCGADQRRRNHAERKRFGRGRRQSAIWAVTIGLLLSLPVLIDQASGRGNLGRAMGLGREDALGLRAGMRTVVVALGAPPAWLAPGVDPFVLLRGPRLIDLAVFALTMAALAWVLVSASRRRDPATQALAHSALIALLAAVVAVAWVPDGGAVLAAWPMQVLRPVTLLAWLAIGWGGWRAIDQAVLARLQEPKARWSVAAVGSAAALVVIIATATGPTRTEIHGGGLDAPVAALRPEILEAVDGQRLVQVNATGSAARRYLRPAIIEELERNGIATTTGEADAALRRGGDDEDPTATLWIASDPFEPRSPSPDADLVARADLVDGGGVSGVAQRRAQLRALIDQAGRVQLRDGDQLRVADLGADYFRWTTPPPDARSLPASSVSVDEFVDLARNGLVASPQVDPALIDALADAAHGRDGAAEDTEAAVYVQIS